MLNTTIIAFGVLIVTIPTALFLAALIYHRTRSRFAGFYETAVFLPHVVSLVPAAMAWKWIFDARLGPLNALLGWFGVEPKAWLFDPALSLVCIIVLCAWQALGYAVLIYLVGFKNLPQSLYEAARLDGASALQSFWYLSIPLLKPITLYVSVVTLVSGFNVYAQAFILASDVQGAPGRQVRVLVLDMLENSFRNYRVGYAASEAVVLLVIVLILTLIQFTCCARKGPGMTMTPHRRRSTMWSATRPPPKVRLTNLVIDAFLIAFGLAMLLPLVLLVANAFKTPQEILLWPPTIVPHQPTLENFKSVLSETPLLTWIWNSLLFACLSTASITATSAIAGYILGKFLFENSHHRLCHHPCDRDHSVRSLHDPAVFPGKGARRPEFGLGTAGRLSRHEFWHLPDPAERHSFDPRRTARSRPDRWRRRILGILLFVLPLLRAPLAALGVLAFFQAWTAFTWPLIVSSTKTSYTIEVGLALFQSGFTVDVGRLSAASSVVLIPSVTLFVLLRRQFRPGRREHRLEGVSMKGASIAGSKQRVALIGLGMAVTPHARALRDLSDRVEVVHAYSPTPARRRPSVATSIFRRPSGSKPFWRIARSKRS